MLHQARRADDAIELEGQQQPYHLPNNCSVERQVNEKIGVRESCMSVPEVSFALGIGKWCAPGLDIDFYD